MERIMIGMRCMDIASSFGMIVFGPWAMPLDVTAVGAKSKTFGPCSASGFFSISCLDPSGIPSFRHSTFFSRHDTIGPVNNMPNI
jgi:hypothetical protein